jgi:GT2 family glycosyltransferase
MHSPDHLLSRVRPRYVAFRAVATTFRRRSRAARPARLRQGHSIARVRVSAVVLHHDFWPGVRPALDALLAQHPDEVVVVDNGSDGTAIAAAYPSVRVVETGANLGYAGGMNAGIAATRDADAVLLLTHECVLAPGALAALSARLEEEPRLGVAGPLLGLLDDEDRVFSAGGWFEPRTGGHGHHRRPPYVRDWKGRPPHPVDWLDGAALLFRREALRAGGPLDEDYFLYYEETAYQLRLRRLGWRVECVPAAVAWQRPGSPPKRLYVRNMLLCLERTGARRALARRYLGSVTQAVVERDRERLLGVLDYTLRRWGPAR